MIITSENNYRGLDEWLEGSKKVFLVCDESLNFITDINKKLNEVKQKIVRFSNFKPNPLYESVVEGVRVFRETGCDSIIAIGGGSAMDVAKCIKLYSNLPGDGEDGSWLIRTISLFLLCQQRQVLDQKQHAMLLFTIMEQNKVLQVKVSFLIQSLWIRMF